MNTPVNFEIAKLLNKKGLYISSEKRYNRKGTFEYSKSWSVAAPSISEVVMWLYKKHGIWISVYIMDKWLPNGNDREQLFDYSLKQMKLGLIDIPKKPEEFNSPTEAYEAAIKYSLDKIK